MYLNVVEKKQKKYVSAVGPSLEIFTFVVAKKIKNICIYQLYTYYG